MPALTINTSPPTKATQDHEPKLSTKSRSASPEQPPFSPITPVLGPRRAPKAVESIPLHAPPARQTYTHSQPDQTVIPQPPPVPIKFESNPDVLAVRSAIAILQLQAQNAQNDMQTLQQIKERALNDPQAFLDAATTGNITSSANALLYARRDDDDDDYDEQMEDAPRENAPEQWPKVPIPQNVVRCPPINWHQYAVEGESLDRLHADQQARPSEGFPQQMSTGGQIHFGGEGQRRSTAGIALPYQPGNDRIERPSVKKGGRR